MTRIAFRRGYLFLLIMLMVAGPTRPSAADHPGSTLEQQWELLNGARIGLTESSYSIRIDRGGTGGLDPVPAVDLQVVGRVTGATKQGSWTVRLESWTQVLAQVSFGASNTSYVMKTAALPAGPASFFKISIIRNAPVGSLAGTLDLTKVTARLRQSGVIKRTEGRIPLALEQDPSLPPPKVLRHQHRNIDVNPEPQVRLEYSYSGLMVGLEHGDVSLVNQDGDVLFTDHIYSSSANSNVSPPLDLVDGDVYHVNVTGIGSWTLHGADLVYSQSTTYEHGLARAVAYFPSVTTPTDLVATGPLGFQLASPMDAGTFESATWTSLIRRTSSLGTVSADLVAGGTVIAQTTPTSSAAITTRSTPLDAAPPAGVLDTKSVLSGGGQGQVVSTLLRIISRLRGLIGEVDVSTDAFSPNGDGTLDTVVLSAEIDPSAAPVSWQISILDDVGMLDGPPTDPLVTFTVEGSSFTTAWDGVFNSVAFPDGSVVDEKVLDGTYTVLFEATDPSGVTDQVTASVTVDTRPPSLAHVYPRNGHNTAFLSQSIYAQIGETGTSVAPASLAVTVTDDSSGAATTFAGASISFDEGTGWLSTPPVSLQQGHVYSLRILAADTVGNSIEFLSSEQPGGGFLATTATVGTATASIPATPCDLGPPEGGTRTASCLSAPLRLSTASVNMSGSRNAGEIFLRVDVPLTSAMVRGEGATGPAELPAYQAGDPNWDPVTEALTVQLSAPSNDAIQASASLYVVPDIARARTLEVQVPADWNSASIDMAPVVVQPEATWCDDPRALTCTPNPVVDHDFVWRAPTTAAHFAACDSVLRHRPAIAVDPTLDLELSVEVDTDRFDPQSAALWYRIGSGPNQQVAGTLTGSGDYSFVVPQAELSEGDALAYSFTAQGTFLDAGCAAWDTAQAPPIAGFRARATADVSADNGLLNRTVPQALSPILVDRSIPEDITSEELCASYFSSPTPCDLGDPSTPDDQTQSVIGDEPGALIAAEAGGGGSASSNRTCRVRHRDFSNWVHEEFHGQNLYSPWHFAGLEGGTYFNVYSDTDPGEDGWWQPETHSWSQSVINDTDICIQGMGQLFPCVPNPGRLKTEARSRIGFTFAIHDPDDVFPDTVKVDARLDWVIFGSERAEASLQPFWDCIGRVTEWGPCLFDETTGSYARSGAYWPNPDNDLYDPLVRKGRILPNGDHTGRATVYSSEPVSASSMSILAPDENEYSYNHNRTSAWDDITIKLSKDDNNDGVIRGSENKIYQFYAHLRTGAWAETVRGIAEGFSDHWSPVHANEPPAALGLNWLDITVPAPFGWSEPGGQCAEVF